jgi:hypothetical protein
VKIHITAAFEKGYIGHPYWPEMEKVINIQKESGVNRARTQQNRDRALRSWLDGHGMTLDDYQQLVRQSQEPFHRRNGATSPIIIPEHHVYGCLTNAADRAPSSIRVCAPEQVRVLLTCSAWETDRTQPDGVWSRFAVVTGAQGKLSNQRALRENPYIAEFTASGTVEFDPDTVDPERLRGFIEWAGREVGIGASRKMGWGRFTVTEWR